MKELGTLSFLLLRKLKIFHILYFILSKDNCRGTADFSNSDVDLHEICERAYEEFHRISYQLQISNQCLVDLRLDLNIFKDAVSKEFHSLNDKMDTVIEVLREKELLPR